MTSEELLEKVYKYAEARYDLDYCGDVRDVLNYLKSLVEKAILQEQRKIDI